MLIVGGAALVLAVLTAVISGDTPATDFGRFHPGVNLVTGVALVGLLLNLVPLIGAARRRQPVPAG